MRGCLNGAQEKQYNGNAAYDIPIGERVSADDYQPRFIAKVMREPYANRIKYFQVRTRSSVNMTAANKHSMALLGGAGALFASLLRHKSAAIYHECYAAAMESGESFRGFMIRRLRAGLTAKDDHIVIAGNTYVVNPWVSAETLNVCIPQAVIDKFASELSNS